MSCAALLDATRCSPQLWSPHGSWTSQAQRLRQGALGACFLRKNGQLSHDVTGLVQRDFWSMIPCLFGRGSYIRDRKGPHFVHVFARCGVVRLLSLHPLHYVNMPLRGSSWTRRIVRRPDHHWENQSSQEFHWCYSSRQHGPSKAHEHEEFSSFEAPAVYPQDQKRIMTYSGRAFHSYAAFLFHTSLKCAQHVVWKSPFEF